MVGASDRAVAPSDSCVTWATRGSRRPSDPLLDIWRKLAGGPTSGSQSRSGIAGPPPLLDIAQVRYRPTSETVSRRGVAGLLWLLSRASFHRLTTREGDRGPVKMRRWRRSLVPQPSCLARGAIGRSPLHERGEVLGWARALSPRCRVSGLPWVFGSSFDSEIFVLSQDMIVRSYRCVKSKCAAFGRNI